MTKEIKTEKFKGIAILAPEIEEWGCELRGRTGRNTLLSFYGNAEAIELPDGEWEIINHSNPELTEEQCADILPKPLERERDNIKGFMIDAMDTEIYSTAKEAFSFLMQSIGAEEGKTYVILGRV